MSSRSPWCSTNYAPVIGRADNSSTREIIVIRRGLAKAKWLADTYFQWWRHSLPASLGLYSGRTLTQPVAWTGQTCYSQVTVETPYSGPLGGPPQTTILAANLSDRAPICENGGDLVWSNSKSKTWTNMMALKCLENIIFCWFRSQRLTNDIK